MATPTPVFNIAVVNDKQSAADINARDLRQLGCNADPIVAGTTDALYGEVRKRLTENDKQYDGVVLDIMYPDNLLGGVELWKRLVADELTPLLGGLMVLSDIEQQSEVVAYFNGIGQEILVLSGATSSSRRRPADFKLFIELLSKQGGE